MRSALSYTIGGACVALFALIWLLGLFKAYCFVVAP